MTTKKLIMLTTGGVASLALAGVIGITAVSAATGTAGTSLADKIATAFHLNSADVQKVIDQDHTDHQVSREANYEARLTQLVTDGKITSAQKDLILAKHKELEAERTADRTADQNLSGADRKAKMNKERTDLEQWAKDNNIPIQYLMIGGPGHGRGMRMGGGMMGDADGNH